VCSVVFVACLIGGGLVGALAHDSVDTCVILKPSVDGGFVVVF